jgi:type II secretory pathway component GspD/PulD (secretin)
MNFGMKYAVFGIALAFTAAEGPMARAQASTEAKPEATSVRTFYFTNVAEPAPESQIISAIGEILPPNARIRSVIEENAFVVRGTPETLKMVENTLHELDRPRQTYRLTYTITEMDAGKRIGVQHCAITLSPGGRTTLKQGSKVPINTGTYDQGKNGTQTQVTYLDIGLNFDTSIDQLAEGVRLHQKIESSGVAEETSGLGAQDPIVRQTVLETSSTLFPGKPLVLGSLDVPGSTRHLEIEVQIEPVK